MTPEFLLLTHSQDYFTTDAVARGLNKRGKECLRIDTDRFPSRATLALDFTQTQSAHWHDGNTAFDFRHVRGVWNRRLWPGAIPSTYDPRFRSYAARVSQQLFLDMLQTLPSTFFCNRLEPQLRAESKPLQLTLAKNLGLRVPDTLITNDPETARAFCSGGASVTKLLQPVVASMNGSPEFVYTQIVDEESLAALDQIRCTPQIFQRLVNKKREWRLVVVGERLFTGELDASKLPEKARLDWRQATTADDVQWKLVTPDDDTSHKVLALVKQLDLSFAALDFLIDDQGPPIFLEANPAGEWGWLEADLSAPIGDAIAECLVQGANK